ncbi:MAG: 1-acyl-sn-glycerol-3-phosphate acyltransferase [Muribaculaceae bacterium]|nr:1-acyl-sn-glycerol-3-phosphate acyltransferase [Muribaculaceae bacterium]
MGLCRLLLKMSGWRVEVSVPDYPKAVICVAPHTSNLDFFLCELAIRSVGRSAGFLMKKSWFFWPLGAMLRAMGGVPVDRSRNTSLTDQLVERYASEPRLVLAFAAEGTRSRTDRWRTGFLRVAREAGVPLLLAAIDAGTRTIRLTDEFIPTDDIQADLTAIKRFYSQFTAIYPEKFSTAPQPPR